MPFAIRRKRDGLYSTGGAFPRFTKQGKVWERAASLKSHMTMVANDRRFYRSLRDDDPYEDIEVVVYVESHALSVDDFKEEY